MKKLSSSSSLTCPPPPEVRNGDAEGGRACEHNNKKWRGFLQLLSLRPNKTEETENVGSSARAEKQGAIERIEWLSGYGVAQRDMREPCCCWVCDR
ncbi:hypothetical protein V6N11_066100 [Hibiscus sabdariffa]|uniref:Uncharacterized protein n=1 Tax=Hibiscus sabdariffa TaxID=183260 RepID=A0ABR2NUL4_9ROSI